MGDPVSLEERLLALEREVAVLRDIEACRDLRHRYHECINEGRYPDLVALAGGAQPLVARAREHFSAGGHLEALRLLDVAKAAGPETRPALQLRLEIFEQMLAASENGHDNMSETGILRASVAQTRRTLEARSD